MQSLCVSLDARFQGMARSQDTIGWGHFMEGMISRSMVEIQHDYLYIHGMLYKLDKCTFGIIIKLLEIMHGQWLYQNIVVHNNVAGSLAIINKEDILAEIEEHMAQGNDGLLDEHKYLLPILTTSKALMALNRSTGCWLFAQLVLLVSLEVMKRCGKICPGFTRNIYHIPRMGMIMIHPVRSIGPRVDWEICSLLFRTALLHGSACGG